MLRTIGTCLAVVGLLLAGPDLASAQENQAPAKAAASAVNINTATVAQLAALPGIGNATAQRIVEHREKNGSFKKIEELMNVRGIGEKSFLKLRPLITVSDGRTAAKD